jgi:hypothetical protein
MLTSIDRHSRTSDPYHSYSLSSHVTDRHRLGQFHSDTIVRLETGENKPIQQLTSHDFLLSAKQHERYSR